jgi:sec-independent protein translocase protein TatB
MFDIGWSELLIFGVVALIFVGPKDLPRFMGTLGRYAGTVRRHAQDFRQQFDDAMREGELAAIKKEVEDVGTVVSSSLAEAERAAASPGEAVKRGLDELTRSDDVKKPEAGTGSDPEASTGASGGSEPAAEAEDGR